LPDAVEERPQVRVGARNVVRGVRLLAEHPVYVRAQARAQREFPPSAADLMILELDRPVNDVPTVSVAAVGPAVGASVVTIGRGATAPDGSGRGPFGQGNVAVVDNASCADQLPDALTRQWSICTRDPRMAGASFPGPFVSACVGDSGGPLLAFRNTTVRVRRVVSWGLACGTERDPEIYANAVEGRAFILARRPVWAPRADGRPTITGTARVGSRVRCAVRWLARPDRATIDFVVSGRQVQSGRSTTYRVQAEDRGRQLACGASGATAGGRYGSALSPAVRVAR
jgi:Trypsin